MIDGPQPYGNAAGGHFGEPGLSHRRALPAAAVARIGARARDPVRTWASSSATLAEKPLRRALHPARPARSACSSTANGRTASAAPGVPARTNWRSTTPLCRGGDRLRQLRGSDGQRMFVFPTVPSSATPAHRGARRTSPSSDWLDAGRLTSPTLHWYLNYCCRDDYGTRADKVSAWAGLHYFASRHGFQAPAEAPAGAQEERESVLTWPQGNGWLTERLAAPLAAGGQLRTGTSVLRITEDRRGVTVDAFNHATDSVERWQAPRCIVALPVFMAARVVQRPPAFLTGAAQRLSWAPWLVANIHIDGALADRRGAAPAWDNVLYADPNPGGLGYVNAGHQRLDPTPAATVLSWYRPLGPSAHDGADGRRRLLERPWSVWRDELVAELSVPHPDLRDLVTRIDITRYGHAMAIPVPGQLAKLGAGRPRIRPGAWPSPMPTGRATRSSRRPSRAGTSPERPPPERERAAARRARRSRLQARISASISFAFTGTPRLMSSQPSCVTKASSSIRMPMFQNSSARSCRGEHRCRALSSAPCRAAGCARACA